MRRNIVFIISDNQSPWTMGCYGNDGGNGRVRAWKASVRAAVP
jgi:hypothetical protein